MIHIRPLPKIIFLFLLAQGVHAKGNTADTDPFFQEMPIVLTASRLSQPLSEAPSPMTVIDKNMIKASGFRTVPDLMRLVPGMYVGFADATKPVVSFNGSQDELARRMQILVDGRSIYLPPHGGVNWADLPLLIEDIERIEVVKGPSSASHGTNSFYGVINIITQEASGQDSGSISATGGQATDASARMNRSGELFDYRLSAGYRSDSGIDNTHLNDHSATKVFNWRSNFHPNNTDSFDFQLGASNGIYGQGIVDRNGVVREDSLFRDTTVRSDFQQLSWSHSWSSLDETKLTYSHTKRRAVDPLVCINITTCDGGTTGVAKSQGFRTHTTDSLRSVLEVQNTNQLGDKNRLVWGGSSNRDFSSTPLLLNQDQTMKSWQVFAHDEWRITDALILNVGSMFEDNGMGEKYNSPRASLNYHLAPEHTVRFGVSTATRSPVISEAFISADNTLWGGGYVSPVKPLKSEKILSKEVGYLGEFRSIGVSVDVRAYIEQVSDLIWWDKFVQATDDYYDSWGNLLAAEYKGVDATVKYHWDEGHSFAVLVYAYQQASASLGATPTQYNSTVASLYSDEPPTIGELTQRFYTEEYLKQFNQTVPKHTASLLVSQNFADSWQASAGYYYRELVRVADVSPNSIVNDGVTPEKVMRRLDLRLAKTFKLPKAQSAELAVVLQNASNDEYTKYGTLEETAIRLFARRGWITATFNF